MQNQFLKGVLLGSLVAAIVMMAGTALAGSGVGAVFNLGKANAVNRASTLTGTTSGKMLQVTNKGAGPALGLTVKSGKAPLTVNSGGKVANLNADKLDGADAADFVATSALATLDADTVDGKHAVDFIATAALPTLDADTVDGLHSSDLVQGGGTLVQGRLTLATRLESGDLLTVPGFGVIRVTGTYCALRNTLSAENVSVWRGAMHESCAPGENGSGLTGISLSSDVASSGTFLLSTSTHMATVTVAGFHDPETGNYVWAAQGIVQ